MDYTAEQINSAFENISPLRNKAMSRFDIDNISDEIVKKYELFDEEKSSSIKISIVLTVIELMSIKDFGQLVIRESGLSYEKSMDLVSDIEKMLLTPIKEMAEDFKNEEEFIKEMEIKEEIEIPLPPYAPVPEIPMPVDNQNVEEENKIETIQENISNPAEEKISEPIEEKAPEPVVPKTEEGIYENSGIEMMPEEILPNTEASEQKSESEVILEEKDMTPKEDNIMVDSGVDVVPELPIQKEEEVLQPIETEKVMMDSVEHPESIAKNILMDKLKGSSVSETVVSDYSLPKMSADKHTGTDPI